MSKLPYLQRHRALIAPRIEFFLSDSKGLANSLPSIGSRIEVTSERLGGGDDPEQFKEAPRPGTSAARVNVKAEAPAQLLGASPTASKIPKPPGEPGRPKSGGYSLITTLVESHNWAQESAAELSEATRSEARKQLDMTVSYRGQKSRAVQRVCDLMTQRWPSLNDYEGCWPVHSILKMTLKYNTEKSRRIRSKATEKRLRGILRGSAGGSDTSEGY